MAAFLSAVALHNTLRIKDIVALSDTASAICAAVCLGRLSFAGLGGFGGVERELVVAVDLVRGWRWGGRRGTAVAMAASKGLVLGHE